LPYLIVAIKPPVLQGVAGKERQNTDYPGHEEAKTPEELMVLPFLDGKTIFERFDELRFFDY
jgi:hypothetical protein